MKTLSLSILYSLIFFSVFAQETLLIPFDPKNATPLKASFKEVYVIDKRKENTQIVGYIKSKKKEQIAIKSDLPLIESIQKYYTSLSKPSPQTGISKLIIVLYKFDVNEIDNGHSDKVARFDYVADYYIDGQEEKYSLLGVIDTSVFVSSLDITQKILKKVDQTLSVFLNGAHKIPQVRNTYSYQDVMDSENALKRNIPAYYSDSFSNSYYEKWDEFLYLNSIQSNLKLIQKKDKLLIQVNSENKKFNAVPLPDNTRFVAFENKLFVYADRKLCPIYRKDNDLYFVGPYDQTNGSSHNPSAFATAAQYGAAGGAAFMLLNDKMSKTYYYKFKINFRNGIFIPLEEVKLK